MSHDRAADCQGEGKKGRLGFLIRPGAELIGWVGRIRNLVPVILGN